MLSSLQPFIEKKDATLITSHALFQVTPDSLIVKATDQEIGLSITTKDLTTESFGNFTCNGKKILDIVRILKDDKITIEAANEEVVIKQGRSKYKIPSFDASTFPSFPLYESLPKVNIDRSKLITALKKISPTIAINNPKYELNGALIDIKSSVINIVATDTKRLGLYKIEQNSDKNLAIILPKKAIVEIQKIFSSSLKLYYDDTNLIITQDDYFFYTKVINGKFPDYERIIPRELKHTFTISTEDMIEAIRQANILAQDIRVTFDTGEVRFENFNNDKDEVKTAFEANITVDTPFSIGFTCKLVLDFLQQCQSENFVIGLNEPNLPFILKNEQFSTIVMPVAEPTHNAV